MPVIPIRIYLYAAVLALIAGSLWYNVHQHRAYLKLQTADAVQLQQLRDANATFTTTLGRLKTSAAECEAGRIEDQAKTKAALDQRDAEQRRIAAALAKAKSDLALQLAGRCRTWAEQATCGLPDLSTWTTTPSTTP